MARLPSPVETTFYNSPVPRSNSLAYPNAQLTVGFPTSISHMADSVRGNWLGALCTLGLLAVPTPVRAQTINYDTARFERRLQATRATGPIVLDGTLDETAWTDAPVVHGFIQNNPGEGQPASEDTDVRVVYDDEALYVGMFAHDRQPSGIIISDLKKDFNTRAEDIFEVVVDTFHDRRNGYQFATSAAGAKWDAQMTNEGRETNSNWDGIWTVQTRIAENGWYAEMKIPFRTLRFSSASPQTWGINFLRRIRRRNEDSYWSPIQRLDFISRVSMAGTFEGLQGAKPGTDLRVKPYVSSSASRPEGQSGVIGDFDSGVDVKYGVTSGLTWDFTVNTDFSQVEADEQQINLTRFSLFYPEKRDFFLENSGVFQFGQGIDRFQGGIGGRQNAQTDMILFFSRRIGLAGENDDLQIPILAGTRLTGRAGPFSVGALNIQQSKKFSIPATNFTALRLRRNILANSDVGVIMLDKEETGDHFNRTLGADINFQFFRNLRFNGYAAKTFSPQEDVPGSGGDIATRAGYSWRNDFWETRAAYSTVGERFDDEMGFVPRVGIERAEAFIGTHIRPAGVSKWLRDIFPHFQFVNITRSEGGLDSRYIDYHLPFEFQNGAFLEVGLNPSTEDLVEPFEINGERAIDIAPGRYDFNEWFVLLNTNQSARLALEGRYAVGEFYDGYKHTYQVGVKARLNEHLNGGVSVLRNNVDLPSGGFTTNLIAGRINYNFSTRMFLNALLQYNTDVGEWSSNVRFNIIHRPLSDIFLVYNERRDQRTDALIDRAVIAKVTYMVAF